MDKARYRIEPLGPRHDRATFSCGVPALAGYFRERAGQDARRRIAAVYVLVDTTTEEVTGF